MSKFIIQDWAGNHLFKDKVFESFDDGWSFLDEHFNHLSDREKDDELGEYYVIEIKDYIMNKKLTVDEMVETISQSVYENTLGNPETNKQVKDFLNTVTDGYVLVQWPNSQEYMEEEWFDDEAILALGSEDITGSSAYFIPIKRVV